MSFSPSFNSYSNKKLTDIAARVVQEFDSEESYEEFHFRNDSNNADSDSDFEFPFLAKDVFRLTSPVSADHVFQNGLIRPVYPVFNQDLLLQHVEVPSSDSTKGSKIRLPLRKLFNEERESALTATSSSSSDETDELVGVPEETYCVWVPKESGGRCKKSSSAGSNSKRWKFRDLLYRSHSDGSKGNFVF